jgi:predicted dehydrogenase
VKARPIDLVRIGLVGVGARGHTHINELVKLEGLEVRAVCDIAEGKVAAAQEQLVKAGKPKPEGYSRGNTDFRRLCERADLDLILTATPWEWHVPVCLAAMNSGKHAATEVPAALTVDECWSLVDTAEKTGKYCIMLENCAYDRTELMILNMVRQGLFGELIHAEGGYLHDLRSWKFSNVGPGIWRLPHSQKRNGDLYPTHGLGTPAQCMNINRGNRFVRLVSMGSQSRGLNRYAEKVIGPDSPQAKKHYALSDVVSTLIQTKAGQTIVLTHDTDSPHPYSRNLLIQGTKGMVRKYPDEKICLETDDHIFIENKMPEAKWEDLDAYREKYEHPLWKQLGKQAKGAGHGGMDYIQDYRLIRALRTGTAPDMDVYDAVSWSVVSPLSEKSIAGKSIPVDFPDFTRGAWKNRPPLDLVAE